MEVALFCLAKAYPVYLTPPSRHSAVQDTPPSRHFAVYHAPLSRLLVQYPCESSVKNEVVPGYPYGDQEELFDEKTNTSKNLVTLSL